MKIENMTLPWDKFEDCPYEVRFRNAAGTHELRLKASAMTVQKIHFAQLRFKIYDDDERSKNAWFRRLQNKLRDADKQK